MPCDAPRLPLKEAFVYLPACGQAQTRNCASLLPFTGEGALRLGEGRMRALMPSGTVPHPSLAEASDTFSRKREKERAAMQMYSHHGTKAAG